MIRDLVHFGPFNLRPYGLMLLLAFVLGLLLVRRRGRRVGLPDSVPFEIVQVILVTSIAGARFQYVATHWSDYAASPWRIFAIWEGGLTFFGGGILATASVIWWMRSRGLPILRTADVVAPAVALGAALTRIGCFLNGCCFGQKTTWPWGIHFPPGSFAHEALGDVHVHPTQLLQSAWGILVFLYLSRLGLDRRPGTVFWSMVILIPAGRIAVDFLRYHSPTDMVQLAGRSIPDSFILACLLMALGIFGFAALRGRMKGADR